MVWGQLWMDIALFRLLLIMHETPTSLKVRAGFMPIQYTTCPSGGRVDSNDVAEHVDVLCRSLYEQEWGMAPFVDLSMKEGSLRYQPSELISLNMTQPHHLRKLDPLTAVVKSRSHSNFSSEHSADRTNGRTLIHNQSYVLKMGRKFWSFTRCARRQE